MNPLNLTHFISEVERHHDLESFKAYMDAHWADSFVYSGVYLILVFGGKHFMRHRNRFELRPLLAAWSGLLAIFSILGTMRTLPELIASVRDHSWAYSVCVPSFLESGKGTSFWTTMFTLSKVLELGDTAFIVLRKQNLIFLHWYHHVTVLMYVWYSYTERIASGRWFMVMNYCVHSVMYSYYALKAMRFRIPVQVNMVITMLQLIQMVVGITTTLGAYKLLKAGEICSASYNNTQYCLLMYLSYLVLFAHFFYTTYIVEKPKVHENGKKHQ